MGELRLKPETGKFHQQMIDKFCEVVPGAQRAKFMHALLQIDDLEYLHWLKKNDAEYLKKCAIVPDAFMIDSEDYTITCVEVVDTCDISPQKFSRLVNLALILDEDEWRLDLVRFDAYGFCEYNVLQAWCAAKASGDRWQQYHKSGDFTLDALFAARSTLASPAVGKTGEVM